MPESPIPLLPSVFRVLAHLRRARAFHPRGVVLDARWVPEVEVPALAGSPLFARPRPAVLRLSHGVGLPPRLPDLLGLAVKLPDVHGSGRDQDLLFTSSGRGTIGRHLLRPRRQLAGMTLSTLLPYEVSGSGRLPIVARVSSNSPRRTYEEVERKPERCPSFEIRLGRADGPRLAALEPLGPIPADQGEALRFDPWHTGPHLQPVGWVNRVRRPAYPASQEGRGAPPDAAAHDAGPTSSAAGR